MGTLPPLLNPHVPFVAESEDSALGRYTGFAADFYTRLYLEFPTLRGRFSFFRNADSDDVWSVCDHGGRSFGVQLDSLIEVICLWDAGWFDEIGYWMPDPVASAIEEIRQRFLNGEGS